MTHYRARITLERIEPYTASNGFPSEQAMPVSNIEVTGVTAANAMAQVVQHVSHMSSWHHQVEAAQGEHVWLGDLAGFTISTEPGNGGDDTPTVEHRCGWKALLGPGQPLGNIIAEQAIQHRKNGCLPQAEAREDR